MRQMTTERAPSAPADRVERKAYHTPRLEDYGEVGVLTRTLEGPLPYYGDGGSHPNYYSNSAVG